MQGNKFIQRWWLAAVVMSLAVGCAMQKEPAQQAIAAADSAIQAISEQAAKYVPDQWQDLQNSLAAVKADFDKGEYKTALTGATGLLDKTKEVAAAAEAKKQEVVAQLTQQWNSLSSSIQPMVDKVQGRIDSLSKTKKLPKGLAKDSVESAKSTLTAAKQTWTEASSAFAEGQMETALAKGNEVQAKLTEIAAQLAIN